MKICVLTFRISIGMLSLMGTMSKAEPSFSYRSIGCSKNDDCSDTAICHERVCINVCHFEYFMLNRMNCAENAGCVISKPHTAECKCKRGFYGDPYGAKCRKRTKINDY